MSSITRIAAEDVTAEEIELVRNHLWDAVDDNKVERDSALFSLLHDLLDTLSRGEDAAIVYLDTPTYDRGEDNGSE